MRPIVMSAASARTPPLTPERFVSVQGYWADLKAPAFQAPPDDLVAVLPLGATEQHGPHLPLSVDRDLTDAVVDRMWPHLSETQNVLVLPTLAITKSGEHDAFPGTLSLSAATLLAVLGDIGASVARAGVRRLVLLNGHGGNTAALEIAARDLRIAHDMIVVACSWFSFADYDGVIDPDALATDLHGGETETAAMLAARPDLVDMGLARNFTSAVDEWRAISPHIGLTGQPARPAWAAQDLHPDGVCGDASAATADKGERLLNSAAERFAAFLSDFSAFDHLRARQ